MRAIFVYLTIGFLTGLSRAEILEEENVLVLTTENFQEAINENKFIMVEFYAPWCGHCKALAPEYAKAAELLKEEKSDLKLAKIDATESRDIASKYGVGGYPTIKFFRSGEPIPYTKGRNADAIISWMKLKSGPPAKSLASVDDAKEFIGANDIAVIGFFSDQKGSAMKNFFQAAEELDDFGYTFGTTSEPEVFTSYGLKGDGIVLFKSFDEESNELKGTQSSVGTIKDFIISNSLPLLIEFKSKLVYRIVNSKKSALYLIVSSKSDEYSSLMEVAGRIAKEYETKMLTIIMDSEDEDNQRFLNILGVQKDDAPAMRIARSWSLKYIPDSTGLTETKIKQFVDDTLAGKSKRLTWSKSEEIPDDWDKEPVKVLVGKNLDDAISKTKHAFVEFYAPWCGHCKALAPIWEELGEKFKDRDDIMIAKFEATANEVDNVRISSYPTLFLFQYGTTSNTVKFQGQRTLEGMLTFLEEQGIEVEDKKEKKDEL